MLSLHDMTLSLGGLLTPQTPPGADGKEDVCLVKNEKALSIKQIMLLGFNLFWKFQETAK